MCCFLLQIISLKQGEINIATLQGSQDEISELTSKFRNPPLVTLNCNNIPTIVVMQGLSICQAPLISPTNTPTYLGESPSSDPPNHSPLLGAA